MNKTVEKFKNELKLQKIADVNALICGANFTQFNRAIKLAKLVNESVQTFKKSVYSLYKEETNEPIKIALANVYGLSYSYIARLIQVSKCSPEKISNYIDSCKNNGNEPTLLGLLSFGNEPKKDSEPLELTLSYKGKKARISKAGTFTTTLSVDELKKLISFLQSQIPAS